MEWMEWNGKKVFLRTNNNKVYSGVVKNVDCDSKPLIFISLIDKFGNNVTIVHSEILEIKEEQ